MIPGGAGPGELLRPGAPISSRAGMPHTAQKREFLDRTARERPEYRDVLLLFRELFAHIEGREETTGISFAPSEALRAERIAGGFPLLSPDSVRVDREMTIPFLAGVLGVMRKIGRAGTEDLGKIEQGFAAGDVGFATLFSAILSRDRKPIEETAARLGVPPSLLGFVLEIPLRTALERFAETVDAAPLAGWTEGHCPVCGSRPGMGELVGEEGRRLLSCSACSFRWPFQRIKCPFCGNEDPETLSYFTAENGPIRVGVCRKCSRYLKTRDSRQGRADVPLEAEDLATLHLDLLAGREGFERGR